MDWDWEGCEICGGGGEGGGGNELMLRDGGDIEGEIALSGGSVGDDDLLLDRSSSVTLFLLPSAHDGIVVCVFWCHCELGGF